LSECSRGSAEHISLYCVLTSYDEAYKVVYRKWPSRVEGLAHFFAGIPFEIEHATEILPNHGWFIIRDAKDEKVLYSAITADVDVLITGDKDFQDVVIEKPMILLPSEFIWRYGSFELS